MTFSTKILLLSVGALIIVVTIGGLTWRGCHYQQKLEQEQEHSENLAFEIEGLKLIIETMTTDIELSQKGCTGRIEATRQSYKLELEACHKMVNILEGRDAKAEELEKDTDALIRALRDRVGH